MSKYIFAYHGGSAPESAEAAEAGMAQWMTWLGGLECHDMGNPVGLSKTVSSDAIADYGGANPLSGYSIVEAASMDEACEMAKGCPIVVDGSGTVEVAPIMEM